MRVGRWCGWYLAVAVLCVLHVGLLRQITSNYPLFTEPLTGIDFDTHAEQAWRAVDAWNGWGKTWSYDVQMLAGYPTGAVFEIDNKGWELWTILLCKAGLSRVVAFNSFALTVHLLVPVMAYASARLFRFSRWEALVASYLSVAFWFFDSMQRMCWLVGAMSFSAVASGFMLPVALFWRYCDTRKWPYLAIFAVSTAVGHLIHPSAFLFLIVPLMVQFLRTVRTFSRWQTLGVVLSVLFVLAANSWWLAIALRYSHFVIDHRPFFTGSPSLVIWDWLSITRDLMATGLLGTRASFRYLTIGLAFLGMAVLLRRRDRRLATLGLGVVSLLMLAAFGNYLWVTRQLQPYRAMIPAAFLAAVPAGFAVGELWRSARQTRLPWLLWGGAALAGLLVASHLFSDVSYFIPKAFAPVPPLYTGEKIPITASGFPPHPDYRYAPTGNDTDRLVSWFEEHDDGQGRILVEWWVLGEHLAWRTKAQVLGGFRERNLEHSDANIFRRAPEGNLSDDELAAYFERYAVKWVVLTQVLPALEKRTDLLQLVGYFGRHRLYATRTPVSLSDSPNATVTPSMNKIAVSGTEPDRDVLLKFHWHDTLVCRNGCRLRRVPVDEDRVGFIQVPAPHPADFVIENDY